MRLGEMLMGVLSEGLGLEEDRLKKMGCLEGRVLAGHYYPHCPEPDQTIGLTPLSNPRVQTVLLQDQTGRLQLKDGDGWVGATPIDGALAISIGDILQILSNDEYKSVEQKVLANPHQQPRISIAVFFKPGNSECLYGPLPEVTSPQKPALCMHFTPAEFMRKLLSKELVGKSAMNYLKQ